MHASARYSQAYNPGWFKDGSNAEPLHAAEIELSARDPIPESCSISMLNMSGIRSFDETPDSEWGTTSWKDFEEFTRLICGQRSRSNHGCDSIL